MKRLLLGSMIAATLLLTTGCDDDDTKKDDTADTTAPVFTTGATLSMTTGGTVTIVATDDTAPITYALTSGEGFTLSGATLTAPDTATAEGTPASITVTATDSAVTPNTATKTIAVTVSVPSGGDEGTITLNGLTWTTTVVADVDENATTGAKVDFATAQAACVSLGRTLPTMTEFLATIPVTSADDNSTLRTDAFMASAPADFALWASDSDTTSKAFGFFATGDDEGTNERNEAAPGYTTDAEGTNYYTCVKAQ